MDKVKQETFSNFNYEIIKSIDERCVDVKCTYKYKDKTQAHYFSYIKSGNKPASYYISKAKADMDKLVKSKNPATVAKKDHNNSKATFFRRHKKAVIGLTTAVLVAGVAVAATLVILKLTRTTDPTAVTEEEIDKYIEGPTGNTKQVGQQMAINIVSSALQNYEKNNLKQVETKMISSVPVNEIVQSLLKLNSSHGIDPLLLLNSYNDTTQFYANSSFKTKNLYKSYLRGTILSDKKDSKAGTIYTKDDYEGLTEGTNFSSNVTTSLVMKHAANSSKTRFPDEYISFADMKYNYDGYSGPNVEIVNAMEGFSNPVDAGTRIRELMIQSSTELTLFNKAFVRNYIGEYINDFRVSEDDSTVFLKVNLNDEIYKEIPPAMRESIMGVPINYNLDVIWCFKNVGEDGWVLDSFASDGYLAFMYSFMGLADSSNVQMMYEALRYLLPKYVEYNEKGEKLNEPLCINKDKMFTKVTYGKLDEDKSIDDITYNGDKSIESPITAVAMYSPTQSSRDVQEPFETEDYSLYRRVGDPEFNGFSHVGLINPNDENRQCVENSGFVFMVRDKTDEAAKPVVHDYTELEKYLDKDLFEKGKEIDKDSGKYFIKLKKAGWIDYELIFDEKLNITNLIINHHEGFSPVVK